MERIDELKALMDLRDILSLLTPAAWNYAQTIIEDERKRRAPKPAERNGDQAQLLHDIQHLTSGRV
jgi:hypothetical protein